MDEFDLAGVEPFVWLEQHLEGRFFHTTPWVNWQSILVDRAIRPNPTGARKSPLSRGNAYFPLRGCVCIFDWKVRVVEDGVDDTYSYRTRCHPLQGGDGAVTAILVLRDAIAPTLISWRQWQEEGAFGQMVVPYIEAGHSGPVAIEQVERVLAVRLPERKPWPASLLDGASAAEREAIRKALDESG